jgi:transposase
VNKWQKLNEQYAQSAFQGNGHIYTEDAKVAELERLIGQLTIENSLLKKVLAFQERQVQEQPRKEAGQ